MIEQDFIPVAEPVLSFQRIAIPTAQPLSYKASGQEVIPFVTEATEVLPKTISATPVAGGSGGLVRGLLTSSQSS